MKENVLIGLTALVVVGVLVYALKDLSLQAAPARPAPAALAPALPKGAPASTASLGCAVAQNRGPKSQTIALKSQTIALKCAGQKVGPGFALLIGATYEQGVKLKKNQCRYDPLPSVKNDLQLLGYQLERRGFNVVKLNLDAEGPAGATKAFNREKGALLEKLKGTQRATVWIHFSGHGAQIADSAEEGEGRKDEADGLDEVFILPNGAYWRDDDFADEFWGRTWPGEDTQVVITMDSCHSGSANRTNPDRTNRGRGTRGGNSRCKPPPSPTQMRDTPSTPKAKRYASIGASSDNELALEGEIELALEGEISVPGKQERKIGLLTCGLIMGLAGGATISVAELFKATTHAVTDLTDQHPQMWPSDPNSADRVCIPAVLAEKPRISCVTCK